MTDTITLLDGTTYSVPHLEKLMLDDAFYYGELSPKVLSSSSCKLLLDSPKTYHYITKYGQTDTEAFAVGRLVHLMTLEPHRVEEYKIIEVQSKNSKAWQEAKGERHIVTRKEYDEAQRIADAILRNDFAMAYFEGCEFEVPSVGMIHDIPFRGKADAYNGDFIIDLKTTSDLKAFPYSAKKYAYDMQAYIYCTLFGLDYDRFVFIVVDKNSLDVGLYTISENFFNSGSEKLKKATDIYKDFFINQSQDIDSYCIIGELD